MKVVIVAAVSIDGKIAQSQNQSSLDWTSKEDTRFFVEKTKEAGVVVMGRTTFDPIGKPLKGRRLIVMSRDEAKEMEGVEYVDMSAEDLAKQLEAEGVSEVVIAGGASVYSQFLDAGLVTDVFLTVEPIMFGDGVPLASGFDRIDLHLEQMSRLGEQGILLHYTI